MNSVEVASRTYKWARFFGVFMVVIGALQVGNAIYSLVNWGNGGNWFSIAAGVYFFCWGIWTLTQLPKLRAQSSEAEQRLRDAVGPSKVED
ncbi:hypothetical protein [Marisediminicola senii]|uniref:hypothetical protein n=1 Tax=Marisediminicola senii TaxID=2711233 RepID=UPI0013ED6BFB|nr:hypothetical protein [Marisediminicola senii]